MIRNRLILSAAGSILAAAIAMPASAVTLTNAPGGGTVTIDVAAAGSFREATYDPIGPIDTADTTFDSFVYFRLGDSGSRLLLSDLPATITNQTATSLSSTFSSSGLDFSLAQTLSELIDSSSVRTGSLFTQSYSITNSSSSALSFELVRYFDGDLAFDGSISDGGGRLFLDSREVLFETDTAIGSADSDTFVGIYNEGGSNIGYEIASYSGLRSRISDGDGLANTIEGDGADSDQFIDAGNGYDVTLGLGRSFTLAAGASLTFTTATIFGTGAPEDVPLPPDPGAVPEPATWAMMILGFGMVGASARRRRATAVRAAV